jgi:hypothetical protein
VLPGKARAPEVLIVALRFWGGCVSAPDLSRGRRIDVNSILILKELWHRRLLVALSVVAAAAISIAAIYNVGGAPPSISKRTEVNAQGSIEILVDSSRSPIADVGRNLTPLSARAGVFARYIAGGTVIARIAKETGIPVNQIDVAGPAPLPGEAPGAGEPAPELRPYGISIAQRGELPIVAVTTRAPTVREAEALAGAAPKAIRQTVESIQEEDRIPLSQRVEFRALGAARGAPVADALGAKIALPLFLFLLGFFILLILGIPRFRTAWRNADLNQLPGDPEVEPAEAPALLSIPTTEADVSGSADPPQRSRRQS